MINADDRSQGANSIPKCVCSWKNCRTYQKAFRETNHEVFDGVIKLKFVKGHPASEALKASIDRTLRVPQEKSEDWKPGKKEGQDTIRYNVAHHHYTEKHIRKYLSDPKGFSFLKPFSVHGAKKYLFSVDEKETLKIDTADKSEILYLQCPNVPKEVVKAEFLRLKETHAHKGVQKEAAPNATAAAPAVVAEKVQVAVKAPKPGIGERKDSLTVSTSRSNSEDVIRQKEEENRKLKDELDTMKSQLTFLHDMVRKLQEEHYGRGAAGGAVPSGSDHVSVKSGRTSRSRSASNRQSTRGSTRSARSGVPQEIQLAEDEQWNEAGDDWTEYQNEEVYDRTDDDSTNTFQVTYQASKGDDDDGRSVVSRTSRAASIVSASKSIKTLPRELELDDDEGDSESHESLEDDFDSRSYASTVVSRSAHSRSAHSRSGEDHSRHGSRKSFVGQPNAPAKRTGVVQNNAKPARRTSTGTSSVKSGGSRSQSASTSGTYQVTAMEVTDPYGENGTYSGSISHSTGMPHGYGRLEYDRAGRWYEGDWKHGRWTGFGRLSNGDGDYYEGGLKNDHKHGHGIMKFADGRTFEGEYINGQMIEGKMTYQDGSTYEGSWVDGMRHGRGQCVFTDHSVYEGEFREGEFSGMGKMSWSDGGWYEGEWLNGEMHGHGREIRSDGSLRHDGEWCRGQPIRK